MDSNYIYFFQLSFCLVPYEKERKEGNKVKTASNDKESLDRKEQKI